MYACIQQAYASYCGGMLPDCLGRAVFPFSVCTAEVCSFQGASPTLLVSGGGGTSMYFCDMLFELFDIYSNSRDDGARAGGAEDGTLIRPPLIL